MEMVMYYKDQKVDDMTREDLIEAVKVLGQLYQNSHDRIIATHKMYKTIEEARKARDCFV